MANENEAKKAEKSQAGEEAEDEVDDWYDCLPQSRARADLSQGTEGFSAPAALVGNQTLPFVLGLGTR